jgi:hypothetical protein
MTFEPGLPAEEPSPSEELDWLAWLFVTGELTESGCRDWIERLSREPAALLAVERAIDLLDLGETVFQNGQAIHLTGNLSSVPSVSAAIFGVQSPPVGTAIGVPGSGSGDLAATDQPELPNHRVATAVGPRRARRARPAFLAIAASLLALTAGVRWTTQWLEVRQNERMLAAIWADQFSDSCWSETADAWEENDWQDDALATDSVAANGVVAEAGGDASGVATDEAAGVDVGESWILAAALSLEGMLDDEGQPIVF